jgi:predicted transposase/invertase (TIGR01784 family)
VKRKLLAPISHDRPSPTKYILSHMYYYRFLSYRAEAIKELIDLPEDYPYQRETLRHLSMLQVNLEMRQNITKDLREVMMNLAPVYEQWYEKTITEGEQRGITKGKQETARRMLNKNMSLEEIAELTDLTIVQLQALQMEN